MAPNIIEASFLAALSLQPRFVGGIVSCRSLLRKEYIQQTKNINPGFARENCSSSLAELAAESCHQAVLKTNKDLSNCDLLIADTLTPWQVTPSEAQRIALQLGLKITSFDIGTSGASFPMLLQVCQNWGPYAKEEQILLTVAQAPTIYVNYNDSQVAGLFSDVAVTFLLGREPTGCEILATVCKPRQALPNSRLQFSLYEHCKVGSDFMECAVKSNISICWPEIAEIVNSQKRVTVCTNDYGVDVKMLLKSNGCSCEVTYLDTFNQFGDSIGCVMGIGLSHWKESAETGDVFVGFTPGCGQQVGALVVRKV